MCVCWVGGENEGEWGKKSEPLKMGIQNRTSVGGNIQKRTGSHNRFSGRFTHLEESILPAQKLGVYAFSNGSGWCVCVWNSIPGFFFFTFLGTFLE